MLLVFFLLIGFQAAGFPLNLALRPWGVFLRFLFQTNSVITHDRSYTSCHGSKCLSNKNNNTKPSYRICSFAWDGFIMAPVPVAHGHGPFAQVQAVASLVYTTNTRSSDLSAPRHPGCWRSAFFLMVNKPIAQS